MDEDETTAKRPDPSGDPENDSAPVSNEDVGDSAEVSGTETEISPETDAEPVVRKRHHPVRTAGKVALSLLSVVALAATGYGFLTYHRVQSDVHTSDVLALPPDVKAPPTDDGAEDILLVGTDARTDSQGNPLPASVLKRLRTEQADGLNTDTLIVLRVPRGGGKPTATSIPRDTWVDVPQGGQAKINSVYAVAKNAEAARLRGQEDAAAIERDSDQAGRRALVQTVQDFTQVRIDHYAEVNLLGFYLLTEALGGVEVCLNHATDDKDSGAHFRGGLQTISGGDALSFVRQRKNLPHGDLDRIQRQQAFLTSALRKVLTAGTLTNPATMSGLTDALSRSLVVDPGFDLLQLAQQAKGLTSGGITFGTIPVITINGWSPDGKQSIVQVDPDAVRRYFSTLAGRAAAPDGGTPGGRIAPAAYDTPLQTTSVNGVECVD
ncbi:LCP family protein [Amycolatopsis pigmentata]|uniref:LCP family protein n=1 Tax=Amycolatopsis pigmentata TaxID=450801 RepID=A0ABW5GAY1_9PSEU